MNSFSRPIVMLLVACYLLVAASATKPLFAAITIQTAKGRVLTGEVDEQTDDQLLWIRQENEQILLTTSVPWSAIVAASDNGESLPIDQLQTLLQSQATSEPIGFLVQKVVYQAPADYQGKSQSAQVPRRTAQVRSLYVEAFLVNLDQDVEPDGIELAIAALDKHGVPVPVEGSLYVQLWGERIQPHGSLVQYENLEQWTQPVVQVDFTDGVASYAFRFRTTQPEQQDMGLHSDALAQVRLGVFGQGNFSVSVPVPIRRFNPFRDRLQLTRGSRFLPNEQTQEVRYQLPFRTHTRRTSSSPFRIR